MLLITDLVGSVIVIAGFVWAVARGIPRLVRTVSGWLGAFRDFITHLADNTAVTRDLNETVTGVRDDIREVVVTLRQHGEQLADHSVQLADHTKRLGRIEDTAREGSGR